MANKLDFEICQKYANAIPNAEHTELRSLELLGDSDDCVACKYGEQRGNGHMLLSTKRDKSGELMSYFSADKDGHALIIGSSGSGKSQGFGMNLLMNADGRSSFIIMDVKGEYYKNTYDHLCQLYGEQNVKTINFTEPEQSDYHINYMCFLARKWLKVYRNRKLTNAQKRSEWECTVNAIRKYVDVLFEVKNDRDKTWGNTAKQFITGLILALFEDLTLTKRQEKKTKRCRTTPEMITFNNIEKILRSVDLGNGYRNSFNDNGFLTGREKDSLAYQYTISVICNASTTRANYLGFVDSYLKEVTDPKISAISVYDDFDIESLGEVPQVVFIIYNISDIAMREFVNKVVAQELNLLLESTHKTVKPLDVPVKLFLDEFPTLRPCEVYPNLLATSRSSNIFLYMVVKSYSQLQARYPDEFRAMIENCNYTFFIGTNDFDTAKHFAAELGQTTVPNPIDYLHGTFNCLTVPVVSQDYLMHRMKDGEVFIKIHRRQPIHGFFEFFYKTAEYARDTPVERKKVIHRQVVNAIYDAPWLHPNEDEDEDEDDDYWEPLPEPEKCKISISEFDSNDEYAKVIWTCMKKGVAGVSVLQRHLSVSYSQAKELTERMIIDGYIKQSKKADCGYEITITEEQFRKRFCNKDEANRQTEISDKEQDDDDELLDGDFSEDPYQEEWERLKIEMSELYKNKADTENVSANDCVEEVKPLPTLYTSGFDMQKAISEVENLDNEVNVMLGKPFPEKDFNEQVKQHWESKNQFENYCMDLIERIISMNKQWTRSDAIKEAAKELIGVRDTQDVKVILIHMKVVYEFQIATDEEYNLLRKQIFSS